MSEERGGPGAGEGRRLDLLDLWRSLAVLLMLLYHACFDLAEFGWLRPAVLTAPGFRVVQALGGGSFVLLSGICVRFSRDPLYRGFRLLCAAAAVTAVTVPAGRPILFGALHLLGCCVSLWGLFRERLEGCLSEGYAVPVLAGLFCLAAWLLPRLRVPLPFLFPLGLTGPGFRSWDYYPLLPWGLLFLVGTCLGRDIAARLPPVRLPGLFTFPGRYSLWFYLLHQPVFLLLLYLFSPLARNASQYAR